MKKKTFLLSVVLLATTLFTACKEEDEGLSVKGIILSQTALNLKPGLTETLTVTIFPSNAANKTVTWNSSDEEIVRVENGLVTAMKPDGDQ